MAVAKTDGVYNFTATSRLLTAQQAAATEFSANLRATIGPIELVC